MGVGRRQVNHRLTRQRIGMVSERESLAQFHDGLGELHAKIRESSLPPCRPPQRKPLHPTRRHPTHRLHGGSVRYTGQHAAGCIDRRRSPPSAPVEDSASRPSASPPDRNRKTPVAVSSSVKDRAIRCRFPERTPNGLRHFTDGCGFSRSRTPFHVFRAIAFREALNLLLHRGALRSPIVNPIAGVPYHTSKPGEETHKYTDASVRNGIGRKGSGSPTGKERPSDGAFRLTRLIVPDQPITYTSW